MKQGLFKLFIFIVLLVFGHSTNLLAGNPETAINRITLPSPPDPCDLDAPASVWIAGMGGNAVTVEWTPVPGAASYATWLVTQNGAAAAAPVYSTTTKAVLPVPAPGMYTVKVAAIAPGGCPPSTQARAIGPQFLPIATELIAVGRSADHCTELNNNLIPCMQIPNVTSENWYSIKKNGQPIGRFLVQLTVDPLGGLGTSIRIGEDPAFPATKTIGEKNGNWVCVPPVQVMPQPTKIRFADACSNGNNYFDLIFPPTSTIDQIELCFEVFQENLSINKLLCAKYEPGKSGERSWDNGADAGQGLVLQVVNPFSDALRVYQQDPESDQMIHFQLLNMAGHLLFEQSAAASSEYVLPTTDVPAGFYFFRVESKGFAKIFKVVKGQ